MNAPPPDSKFWDFLSVAVQGAVVIVMLGPWFGGYNKYTVADVGVVLAAMAAAGGGRAIQRFFKKRHDEE